MARRRSPFSSNWANRRKPPWNVLRASASSFFSASVNSSGGLRVSSRNRPRFFWASGSGGSSRLMTAKAFTCTESTPRACNHWPTKCRTNSFDFGSASIRLNWAWRFVRNLPSLARRVNSASGMVDQRKYDSRLARAYSSISG